MVASLDNMMVVGECAVGYSHDGSLDEICPSVLDALDRVEQRPKLPNHWRILIAKTSLGIHKFNYDVYLENLKASN